jgi:hypothetical protein
MMAISRSNIPLALIGSLRTPILVLPLPKSIPFSYAQLTFLPWRWRQKFLPWRWYVMSFTTIGAEIAHSVYRLATGWTAEGFGVRFSVGLRIFTSPCRPDRFWGPPSLLRNGYRGFSPAVKLTTQLQLVPRSRKRGSIHSLPHTPSWRSA